MYALDLAPHLRDVLLVLADHANPNGGGARPGNRRIAWKLGMSPRSVQRALRELRRLKMIVAVGPATAPGRAAEYTLLLFNGTYKAPFQENLFSPTDDTHDVRTGDTHDGNGRHSSVTPTPLEPKPTEAYASVQGRRDRAFEVLAEETGYDPRELTRTARGELNRALADIRVVAGDLNGRLPEEIARRAVNYVRAHPGWELTPSALAKWWPTLAQVRAPPQQQRFESAATTWLRARAGEVTADESEGGAGPSIAARPGLPGPLN